MNDDDILTIITDPKFPDPTDTISTIDLGYVSKLTMDSSTNATTTICLDDLIDDDLNFDITTVDNTPVEFVDTMPDVSKIEDMCNDYPALAQSYEKFKTLYAMVHQDWKGKQKEDGIRLPF